MKETSIATLTSCLTYLASSGQWFPVRRPDFPANILHSIPKGMRSSRFIWLLVPLLTLFVIPQSSSAQSVAEAYPAIAQTVNYYLEGGTNNDFDTLKKAFHETATMKYMRDGAYNEVNALDFFERGMKPGPPQNRKTRIVSIDVAGDAAFAKLEIEYPTFTFVDYMHLLHVDGEWKIVSKIFYRQPKATG